MDNAFTTGIGPVGPLAAPAAVTVMPYRHEDPLFWISVYVAGSLWLVLLLVTFGLVIPFVLFMGLLGLFTRSLLISWVRGNALRVSPEQFPDLHQHFMHSCQRLGVKRVPEFYLCQADGMLNALAVRFMRQDYVVLLSCIVDALKDRPEAIRFYMGHELAHIQRKHLTRHWWLAPAGLMPLLAPAYSRAREYTCDRHGLACCNNLEDAQRALVVLAAGSERWKQVNLGAFEAQSGETGRFWMAVNELTSDYPWLSKRLVHLRDRNASFPRRSVWAWAIAAVSPRLGYGGAVIGFLYLLIMGVAVLVLVTALSLRGSAIADSIEHLWHRVVSQVGPEKTDGEASASSDATSADASEAELAAAAEVMEPLSADETHAIGQVLAQAIDGHAASNNGQFPETLGSVDGLADALHERVGKRWQGVSFGYLAPGESGSKAAEITLEHRCTECSDETLTLHFQRQQAGEWTCTVTGEVDGVTVQGCTADR